MSCKMSGFLYLISGAVNREVGGGGTQTTYSHTTNTCYLTNRDLVKDMELQTCQYLWHSLKSQHKKWYYQKLHRMHSVPSL